MNIKKLGFIFAAVVLVMSALESCEFLIGPDESASGNGDLVISFGKGSGQGADRAITSGADLPKDVLEALRYELTLTGPGGEVLTRTVAGVENIKLVVALGVWRIDVRAYKEDGLAGTRSVSLTVGPGVNSVNVPMTLNKGYFSVTSATANGTVQSSLDAAFPETTVTLTVTPDSGYVLKAGTVKYNDGTADYPLAPDESDSTYSFTMPASDITVSAEFNTIVGAITIEGPHDETVAVTAVHSAGHTPSTTISWEAGASVTFTVNSSGYTAEAGNLVWFVDGVPVTGASGESLTINARDYVARSYSLIVMIKVNDQWYSADSGFTVVK